MRNIGIPAVDTFYQSEKWRIEDWYWARNTNGIEADFLPHQGGKIVYHMDRSEWARTCLLNTIALANDGKRWPDHMNDHPSVVNTWIGRIINRMINKLFDKDLPFRYQGRMVRDSYTAIYPAMILHGMEWDIQNYKPKWYVFSPTFYFWRQYLITLRPIYLELYRTFSRPSKHEWRQRLHWLRETAILWVK